MWRRLLTLIMTATATWAEPFQSHVGPEAWVWTAQPAPAAIVFRNLSLSLGVDFVHVSVRRHEDDPYISVYEHTGPALLPTMVHLPILPDTGKVRIQLDRHLIGAHVAGETWTRTCLDNCSQHGICQTTGVCACDAMWRGPSCSWPLLQLSATEPLTLPNQTVTYLLLPPALHAVVESHDAHLMALALDPVPLHPGLLSVATTEDLLMGLDRHVLIVDITSPGIVLTIWGAQATVRLRVSNIPGEYPCPFECSGVGDCEATTGTCHCPIAHTGVYCQYPVLPWPDMPWTGQLGFGALQTFRLTLRAGRNYRFFAYVHPVVSHIDLLLDHDGPPELDPHLGAPVNLQTERQIVEWALNRTVVSRTATPRRDMEVWLTVFHRFRVLTERLGHNGTELIEHSEDVPTVRLQVSSAAIPAWPCLDDPVTNRTCGGHVCIDQDGTCDCAKHQTSPGCTVRHTRITDNLVLPLSNQHPWIALWQPRGHPPQFVHMSPPGPHFLIGAHGRAPTWTDYDFLLYQTGTVPATDHEPIFLLAGTLDYPKYALALHTAVEQEDASLTIWGMPPPFAMRPWTVYVWAWDVPCRPVRIEVVHTHTSRVLLRHGMRPNPINGSFTDVSLRWDQHIVLEPWCGEACGVPGEPSFLPDGGTHWRPTRLQSGVWYVGVVVAMDNVTLDTPPVFRATCDTEPSAHPTCNVCGTRGTWQGRAFHVDTSVPFLCRGMCECDQNYTGPWCDLQFSTSLTDTTITTDATITTDTTATTTTTTLTTPPTPLPNVSFASNDMPPKTNHTNTNIAIAFIILLIILVFVCCVNPGCYEKIMDKYRNLVATRRAPVSPDMASQRLQAV